MKSSEPDINYPLLKETCGPEGAREVLSLFLDTIDPLMDKISQAAHIQDSRALQAATHELKGCCTAICSNGLATAAEKLDRRAADPNWVEFKAYLETFLEVLDGTRRYIQYLLNQ